MAVYELKNSLAGTDRKYVPVQVFIGSSGITVVGEGPSVNREGGVTSLINFSSNNNFVSMRDTDPRVSGSFLDEGERIGLTGQIADRGFDGEGALHFQLETQHTVNRPYGVSFNIVNAPEELHDFVELYMRAAEEEAQASAPRLVLLD